MYRPCSAQCRKLMVDMVLATDMAIHFDLLKRFNSQAEEQPDLASWADPNLHFMMLLHLADIANPSRPFHLARGWAKRVITEFCDQVSRVLACGESQSSQHALVQRSDGIARPTPTRARRDAGRQGGARRPAALALLHPRDDEHAHGAARLHQRVPQGQCARGGLCAHVVERARPGMPLLTLSRAPALRPQPTLLAYERAAPSFVQMALKQLDNTIAEWTALQAAGFKM